MAEAALTRLTPAPPARRLPLGGAALAGGTALWLSLIVLLPLAAVVSSAFGGGVGAAWRAATGSEARSALELTLALSAIAAGVNAVAGTAIAWVLVRDSFRGRRLIEALVDLPFALPTIVAGLTLLALYGPRGPVGVDVAFTRAGVLLALLFVTLPFGVRAVQPVLMELDPDVEAAAASLGARPRAIVRRVILPALAPAIAGGAALAFARALGEFGAVVLISGNLPFKTEYASVVIFGRIETGDQHAAAAISVVLLLLSVLVLGALQAVSRRGSRR